MYKDCTQNADIHTRIHTHAHTRIHHARTHTVCLIIFLLRLKSATIDTFCPSFGGSGVMVSLFSLNESPDLPAGKNNLIALAFLN